MMKSAFRFLALTQVLCIGGILQRFPVASAFAFLHPNSLCTPPFSVSQAHHDYYFLVNNRQTRIQHGGIPNKQDIIRLSMGGDDASSSNNKNDEPLLPKPGCVVTIECCLRPDGDFIPEPLFDGICVDDQKPKTLTFVLGQGNYLPGLHELVGTLKVGDAPVTEILDAGWGHRNANLEAYIAFADMKQPGFDKTKIRPGVQLLLANGLKAEVTEVTDEKFKIDANPPLAGASYTAHVKLVKVEEGPDVEAVYPAAQDKSKSASRFEVATIALGCFWGVELEYMREPGVVGTKVGYTQGETQNPTYKEVCSGTTGHAEAVLVQYDPDVVSYDRLVHLAMGRLGENKYLLNQVGNDKGTQYRHGIYYHTDEQKEIAENIIKSFGEGCKTECLPAVKFWDAEDYHQQYLLKGGQSAKKSDKSAIRCYG